ncbi:MAG: SRPBCC domain-containing protein [Melioribacteraceae bacterium]
MASIKHYLIIRTPVEIVYKALTQQEALAGWWTPETFTKSKVGSIIDFIFGKNSHDQMKILVLAKNKKVEWECVQGDPEWVGTRICFDLVGKNNSTVLRFTHSKWKKETDFLATCNYHWGYFLRSLKLFCETGKGTPFGTNEYQ